MSVAVASPSEIRVRQIRELRVSGLFEVLSEVPHLAFHPWEKELVGLTSTRFPSVNLALMDGEICLGAVIAGKVGKRATISHLGMVEQARRQGYGSLLVSQVLEGFRAMGCTYVHLIVTPENQGGLRFWKKMGFEEVQDRVILECDPNVEDASLPSRFSNAVTDGGFCFHGSHELPDVLGGGSYGVRGAVNISSSIRELMLGDLLNAAKKWFAENGVFRAHAIVKKDDTRRQILESRGFVQQTGEILMEMQLS